jgi:cholesterol oxidase
LRARKRWFGTGFRLTTQQNRDRPNPTYIDIGNRAAQWLAQHTGGIAQSNVLEAIGNIPTTAHLVGGAVIGADAASGVIDRRLRVFGYENMLVCDGAAMPANPGVNPALTITALAEYAMSQIPAATSERGSRDVHAKSSGAVPEDSYRGDRLAEVRPTAMVFRPR